MKLIDLDPVSKARVVRKTLYVHRPLQNAEALIAWAKKQGFATCLPEDDFHVTIAFSRTKVDWSDTTPMLDTLRVRGGKRSVTPLGDKGAIVLKFECEDLQERWHDLTENVGCSWDYPSYQPHVTITYDGKDTDLTGITPFDEVLVFGPEDFSELNDDYIDSVKETELTEATMALGDGLDPTHAYDIFRASYERETGSSWSKEKFLTRAAGWRFYGTPDGFVAVRPQASGPLKLVGVAGDKRGVMLGLQELRDMGAPIWGAVSLPLARLAEKRGMIAPHSLPGGPLLVRTLIKTVPDSVFGGATPQVAKDGGVVFDYADTGPAEKYLIGNKAYFAHAIRLPHVMDALRATPAVATTLRLLSRMLGLSMRA